MSDLPLEDIKTLLAAMTQQQREDFIHGLPESQRGALGEFLKAEQPLWVPLEGPQTKALESPADIVFFGGSAGGGKLLPLDTLVATPSGFTPMGEIRVGDSVLSRSGEREKVIAVSGVDPAPQLMEFTFDDGTRCVSCVDHRWITSSAVELIQLTRADPQWKKRRREKRPSRAKHQSRASFLLRERNTVEAALRRESSTEGVATESVRTTREIADTERTPTGRKNHAVRNAAPLDLPPANLLVDPYTLGAWLGDGTCHGGGFTGEDPEIVEVIRGAGYEVVHSRNYPLYWGIHGLRGQLKTLGVLSNKHIPQQYLRGSGGQRLELLRGLMDTDGTVARHSGAAEFCNTNEAIIDGIVELIASLGWKARKREGRAKLYGRDCGPKWTVKWVASKVVFRLPRKAVLQTIAKRRTTRFRYLCKVRPVPSHPGRCIQVSSKDGSYLIGKELLPTHNSDCLIGAALTTHRKSIIFRREATQLTGIVDRMTELLGGRDGYNGTERIWRVPSTIQGLPDHDVQVEFGSTPNPGDETRYQGRPHDLLCVGRGTPIWMGDHTTKRVEDIVAGDEVATLEGPKRVERVHPKQWKPCVKVRMLRADGTVVGEQVQSTNHEVLTTCGWVGAWGVPSLVPAATRCRGNRKPFGESGGQYGGLCSSPSIASCPQHTDGSCQPEPRTYSRSESYAFGGLWSWGIEGVKYCGRSLVSSLLALWYALQGRAEPSLSLSSPSGPHNGYACAKSGVRWWSSAGDSQGNCSGGSHQCDERTPVEKYPRRRPGVAPSGHGRLLVPVTPTRFSWRGGGGGEIRTPAHAVLGYDHPYTREKRQISGSVLALQEFSYEVSYVGVREVFDLQVEDVRHYITSSGFVNKNCVDELSNFLEAQFRFLMGWLRTTTPGQRCRVLCTGNPPTTPEGEWVRQFWAPWLDPEHPTPADPGELRWFCSYAGVDRAVPKEMVDLSAALNTPLVYDEALEGLRLADPEERRDDRVEKIRPTSRTYIPSRVTDNPYLLNTGYMATLQALPEPLRSQMLYGDFSAGHEDDAWQVLPSGWVEMAQKRWKEKEKGPLGAQTAIGVDVSRGGKDEAVIAIARGDFIEELVAIPGRDVPDGPALGAEVLRVRRDQAVINVDAIGVGSSVLDFLNGQGVDVSAVTGSERGTGKDLTGTFSYRNLRAKMYWRLRERLDPKNKPTLCMPPDSALLADLCSARYRIRDGNILVIESKADIYSRLKRSPDRADAVIYATWEDSQRNEKEFFETETRWNRDPLDPKPYSRIPAAAFAAGYSQGVRHARYQ